ncbi:MAG: GatB/YqeY domain-containing protein [Gemmatimonadetes bacterium]|nr:GatB/YqeY domain-containing protein [Gemmatimonadota bacterium]
MADTLKERMRSDLNEARKSKDRLRTSVLTMTLSEVRNREIDLGRALEDADVVAVVSKAMKQRKEAADQMRQAGREELAEKEEQEARVLDAYTPESMDETEVRALVKDAIASGADNMGAVMGALMPRIKGRFDGKDANRIVREELG